MGELPVSVRRAREVDLAAIQRIYNREIETGTATWDELPWPMEKRRAWWATHNDVTPILVAETGGECIGFAYLSLMSDKSGWRFTREDTIYIDERFRGLGVGRVLLPALIIEAKRVGVRLLVASITSTNEASLALHARFGFEVMGTMRQAGFKFGKWMDTTYMQLVLE
jgi:L-amino acid N-acyltransferase YncA